MTTLQDEPGFDVDVELGIAVHSAMFRRKVSQTDVGRALGIGQSTVSSKLAGRTRFTVAELYSVAQLLDVEPGELLPRARRDSNPKPSDLCSAGARLSPEVPMRAPAALTLVRGGLTLKSRVPVRPTVRLAVVS